MPGLKSSQVSCEGWWLSDWSWEVVMPSRLLSLQLCRVEKKLELISVNKRTVNFHICILNHDMKPSRWSCPKLTAGRLPSGRTAEGRDRPKTGYGWDKLVHSRNRRSASLKRLTPAPAKDRRWPSPRSSHSRSRPLAHFTLTIPLAISITTTRHQYPTPLRS